MRIGLNEARIDVKEGRGRGAVKVLQALETEALRLGLRYESIECSLLLAEASLAMQQHNVALERLQRVLTDAERSSMRVLMAQAHHVIASTLRASGGNQADARRHAEAARRLVEEIRKDAGDQVLQRFDLKPIVEETPQ